MWRNKTSFVWSLKTATCGRTLPKTPNCDYIHETPTRTSTVSTRRLNRAPFFDRKRNRRRFLHTPGTEVRELTAAGPRCAAGQPCPNLPLPLQSIRCSTRSWSSLERGRGKKLTSLSIWKRKVKTVPVYSILYCSLISNGRAPHTDSVTRCTIQQQQQQNILKYRKEKNLYTKQLNLFLRIKLLYMKTILKALPKSVFWHVLCDWVTSKDIGTTCNLHVIGWVAHRLWYIMLLTFWNYFFHHNEVVEKLNPGITIEQNEL